MLAAKYRRFNPFTIHTLVTKARFNVSNAEYELQLWKVDDTNNTVELVEVEGFISEEKARSAEFEFWREEFMCQYARYIRVDIDGKFISPMHRSIACKCSTPCKYKDHAEYCTFKGYPNSYNAIPIWPMENKVKSQSKSLLGRMLQYMFGDEKD